MPGPSTASPPSTRFPSSPEQGAHERRPATVPAPRAHEPTDAPPPDSVSDVVRWAAFSCVLVPVVLVGYGGSLAGATGAALGLVAVTGVCRLLLRQSERGAARLLAEQNKGHRGRHGRTGVGAHRGTRQSADSAPLD
ncbi:hypothetical protein [Streptomyces atriruber]|uniref:hypothetical protein n=1 Tax=Streptomyces atriruber TaxID=545121 RepID=UPI000AF3E00F